MGLLDALLGDNSGSGLLGGLPQSWQYPTAAPDAAEEKRKADAAFMASINQDPNAGGFNPGPSGAGPFTPGAPTPGTMPGQYGGSTPFGLGGLNPPQAMAPQGAPASGAFPAVPPAPIFAPQQPAPPMGAAAPPVAPTTAPAGPAGPINTMNIGGYQMPQYGAAADYTPPASVPAPVRAAMAQAPAAAPEQLPQALGGRPTGMLDRINTGLQSLGHGGSIIGALTGNRTDPQSIGQQNLAAQYHAVRQTLIENGQTPEQAASKAMLAVLNPEAGKVILSEALTNKEEFKTIKDGFGGEHPAFVNPRDQTINGKSVDEYNKGGGGGPGAQQTYDAIAQARDGGATHDQLYQMVPAPFRAGVQAMIEGKAVPSNLGARGEARNQAILLAHTIDPTFDESQIPSRIQGNKDFYGGGKSAETMRKTNQSALHFGELVDKMQTLPGGPIPAVNAAGNFINSELLGKDAKGNFIVNGHALADELSSMFKGAGISDTEIRAWESNLSPDMSAQQQRGMAKTLLGLYRDSVSALEKKRQESVGPVVAAQKGPILGPEANAALDKVEKFANGGQTAPTIQNGATATNQKTGQKITFINGKWQ